MRSGPTVLLEGCGLRVCDGIEFPAHCPQAPVADCCVHRGVGAGVFSRSSVVRVESQNWEIRDTLEVRGTSSKGEKKLYLPK